MTRPGTEPWSPEPLAIYILQQFMDVTISLGGFVAD